MARRQGSHPGRRRPPARSCGAPWRAAIEIKQLRYFARIVELGSLSRAAGALHIAQSALSQHVAALESQLQVPLLHRTARGVVPTEAGRTLYQHANILLKNAADAKEAVAQSAAEPSGHVALGLPLSLVAHLGLPILAAVRARHPKIRLQILEELSGTILEWVKNGRLTAGIGFDDGDFEGLRTTPLLEERLFLVVTPRSPLARRKTVAVRELAELPMVLPTAGQGVRVRVDRALSEAGLGKARIVAEVDSHTLMKQAAADDLGCTILSWASVEAEVGRGEVCAIEIVRPAITRVAHLCMLATATPSRAAECVAEQIVDAVGVAARRVGWRGVRVLGSPGSPPTRG